MKITIENIVTEYPKLKQSDLPKALKNEEYSFVKENLDLYYDDLDIENYIETFILKLNEITEKEGKIIVKKGVVKIPKNRKTIKKSIIKRNSRKWKPLFKIGQRAIWTSSSTKKEYKGTIIEIDNANAGTYLFKADNWEDADNVGESGLRLEKRTVKRKVKTKRVGNIDLQITIIKSFVLMQKKTKTKANILNLYKRIEKAATELKIRKTSKYAKELMYVSEFLKDSFNDSKFDVQIPTKEYNKLYDIAYSEKQKDSVRLIKRYVGMYGLEDSEKTEKRAKLLLKAIQSSLNSKKITKSDMYFDKIKMIESNLEAYLLKSKNLHPTGVDLQGLAGIAGMMIVPLKKKSLGGFEENLSLPVGIFSAKEISTQVFDTVVLKDKWKQAIGTISLPFHLLFWGEKGSGKSTLILNLAKYLATEHKLKVLFIAKEEGRSFTLKEKINRLSAAVPNLYFTDKLPADKSFLQQVDVLMIDSVNSVGMTNDELERLKLEFPNLSTVSLLMAYKNGGTYKGDSDFGHNAQAVFKVSEGTWRAEKNRFGGSQEVEIDF